MEEEYKDYVVCNASRQIITCYKGDEVVESCVHWVYQPSSDVELEYVEAQTLDLSEYDRVCVFWLYGKNHVTFGFTDEVDTLKMGKIVVNMPNDKIAEFEYIADERLAKEVDDDDGDYAKYWDIYEYDKEGIEELDDQKIMDDQPDNCYELELIELTSKNLE